MFNEFYLNISLTYMNILGLAGFSALFFVIIELIYKFTNCSSIAPDMFVSYWFIISGIITVPYFIINDYHKKQPSKEVILCIAIIALLSLIGNLIYWNACSQVKNPGTIRAVYSGVLIILISLISAATLKKFLTLLECISILLIVLGISILLINSS